METRQVIIMDHDIFISNAKCHARVARLDVFGNVTLDAYSDIPLKQTYSGIIDNLSVCLKVISSILKMWGWKMSKTFPRLGYHHCIPGCISPASLAAVLCLVTIVIYVDNNNLNSDSHLNLISSSSQLPLSSSCPHLPPTIWDQWRASYRGYLIEN